MLVVLPESLLGHIAVLRRIVVLLMFDSWRHLRAKCCLCFCCFAFSSPLTVLPDCNYYDGDKSEGGECYADANTGVCACRQGRGV